MDKKLLGIGIVLLLVGGLLAFASSQATQAALPNPNNTQTDRAILGNYSVGYIPLQINQTSIVDLEYTSVNATDFFIANQSAYQELLPFIDQNGSSTFNDLSNASGRAQSLEGNGILIAYINQTKGAYPYDPSFAGILPQPNYTSQSSGVLGPGTYYAIFANSEGSPNLVLYSVLARPVSTVGIAETSSAGLGVIGDILVLAGFVLAIYALFARKDPNTPTLQQDIDKMYADLGMEKKKAKAPARKKRRRGKKSRRG